MCCDTQTSLGEAASETKLFLVLLPLEALQRGAGVLPAQNGPQARVPAASGSKGCGVSTGSREEGGAARSPWYINQESLEM